MFLKDEPAFGQPLNRVTGLHRRGMEVGARADGGVGGKEGVLKNQTEYLNIPRSYSRYLKTKQTDWK